jgi:putative ABC transport system substrate-binding protein
MKPLAAKTKTIPIVFTRAADPVGNGFAASLPRPGGNITGVLSFEQQLAPKRLELLKQAVPRLSHVAVLFQPGAPNSMAQMKEVEQAAGRLQMRLMLLDVRQADEIQPALTRGLNAGADGFVVTSAFLISVHRHAIANRLAQAKIPSIFGFSDAGGLMSYAPIVRENFKRAATYVDKILKGANPAELAIEQPTTFELVLNLKTAKAIGLTIPQSLHLRADRVID